MERSGHSDAPPGLPGSDEPIVPAPAAGGRIHLGGESRASRPASTARGSGAPSRQIERRRRLAAQAGQWPALDDRFYQQFTHASFRREQLEISEAEIADALRSSARRRAMRAGRLVRVRNHVAILKYIERLTRRGDVLTVRAVVRWYTSISCGLSIRPLSEEQFPRLEQLLQRMSFGQLRLMAALHEVAGAHLELLRDPFFPAFNGILARLLLHYHLRRCWLPPVMPNGESDLMSGVTDQHKLALHFRELIERMYAMGVLGFEPRTKGL